ncbi:NmrA family NAD(P)-binding protein [Hymenobacter elongatus]|uniref:NAD-dependent epimerase/dehydratase family protein n=1 Tax=Hymenobacter elongatus TaxID=877208 RepID=A0A4Z0PHS0_9BACT|nr:NAD(P)H-binding protein [Hymenobacter elongatus]TGE14714.1 NAD-dependent epimerase/dehydratase family protein [Hymenobacter elongatus]
MKIVITGSLGNIGKPLAEELVLKRHAVTVISSKPERRVAIEALGATAAIGSLEDTEFLATTFAGTEAVFAMVPPNFGAPNQVDYYRSITRRYAQAIVRAGVKRVVHLSSYGAHLDQGTGFVLGSHHAEGLLNELSSVALTHLRAGYFYTNLYGFAGMIKGQGLIGANYGGDDKLELVHPRDIAAVAAEELTTAATAQPVRYVASDECTASEAARILGAAIGKPDLQWLTFTNEQTQRAMEQRGVPAHLVANFVELGASTHSGALREDYEQHKPAAMGKTKLADFAQEFVAAYDKV